MTAMNSLLLESLIFLSSPMTATVYWALTDGTFSTWSD